MFAFAALALAVLGGCGRDNAAAPVEPSPAAARHDEQQARRQIASTAAKVGAAASAAVDVIQSTVSDAAITTAVNGAIAKDDTLSALHVDVDTQDGQVTLRGTAPDAGARERATRLARTVDGVRSVVNRLGIQP